MNSIVIRHCCCIFLLAAFQWLPVYSQHNEHRSVPATARQYLQNNLSAYQLPARTDYAPNWWSFHEKGDALPYMACTDINDDNRADFAFLLRGKGSLVVVILLSRGDSYTHSIGDTLPDAGAIHHGLAIQPPGRLDVVLAGEETSLVLASNGISLLDLERVQKIFYCPGISHIEKLQAQGDVKQYVPVPPERVSPSGNELCIFTIEK